MVLYHDRLVETIREYGGSYQDVVKFSEKTIDLSIDLEAMQKMVSDYFIKQPGADLELRQKMITCTEKIRLALANLLAAPNYFNEQWLIDAYQGTVMKIWKMETQHTYSLLQGDIEARTQYAKNLKIPKFWRWRN